MFSHTDEAFCIRLRNGLYERLSANFWTPVRDWATYLQDPAFGQIHLSYAINTSAPRIFR